MVSLSGLAVPIDPPVTVRLEGAWSRSVRRTYASPAQAGSGEGPYVEAEDVVWNGSIVTDQPLVGILFVNHLREASGWWAKSAASASARAVRIALARWTHEPGAFSFMASFQGAHPPSTTVETDRDPAQSCTIAETLVLGRAEVLAACGEGEVRLLALPRSAVRVGRNGLWSVREELAAGLSEDHRTLLTRRRSGRLHDGGDD